MNAKRRTMAGMTRNGVPTPPPAENAPARRGAGPIRVAIVEDDDWIRDDLAATLDGTPGLCCLGRFASAEEALAALPEAPPDVVLMDIGLPKMNGVECVRRLKALLPSLQVLMLTVYGDSERVFSALLAGADGYLLKRTPTAELIAAIEQVHRGQSPMDGHIARQVVQYFNHRGRAASEVAQLSPREQAVLQLLARGDAYKQIADRLGISIETLRGYIKSIYHKLHVHSRGEAVAKYGSP